MSIDPFNSNRSFVNDSRPTRDPVYIDEKKFWVGLYVLESIESGDLDRPPARTGPGVGYEI